MTVLDQTGPVGRPQATAGSREKARIVFSYLALSAISGFTELGSIVLAIRMGYGLSGILTYGIAYQAGALLTNPIRLSGSQYYGLLSFATALGLFSRSHSFLAPFALFLLSAGLQGMRERLSKSSGVGTLTKRASRIAGFVAVGGFGGMSYWIVPLAVAAITVFGGGTGREDARPQLVSPIARVGATNVIMAIHQMHYFCYSYLVPVVLITILHVKSTAAGISFAVGWISYSLAPLALQRFRTIGTVVVGHLAVAICLIAMAFSLHDVVLFLLAWFASGFGGGTVFGIRRLGKLWQWDRAGDLDTSEQIGHVLGALLAELIALLTASDSVFFITAACLAIAVAVTVGAFHVASRNNADQERFTT